MRPRGISVVWTCLLAIAASASFAQDTGPWGRPIKEIRIVGLEHSREKVVLRELESRVGQPLAEETLAKDRTSLERTDLFTSIEMHPIVDGDEVIVEIAVEETYPWIPFPSVGFSDENGFSFGVGVRTLSLGGQGVTAGAIGRIGGQDTIGLVFEHPNLGAHHFALRAGFGWMKRRNVLNDFDEETLSFRLRASRYLGERGRLAGVFSFMSLESDDPEATLSTGSQDKLPSLAVIVGYDTRDDWRETHHGWFNELEVGWTGGDADYWTWHFDVRRYQPLRDRHTLYVSSLTTLRTGSVGVDIPIYDDYRFGGTNSIRGWEINQRRGKNQQIHTLEYRYELIPLRIVSIFGFKARLGLEVAGFGDLGTLWGGEESFTAGNFIGGGGVGVRALIPSVGRIRLDVGIGQSGFSGVQVHFGIGDKAAKQRQRVR